MIQWSYPPPERVTPTTCGLPTWAPISSAYLHRFQGACPPWVRDRLTTLTSPRLRRHCRIHTSATTRIAEPMQLRPHCPWIGLSPRPRIRRGTMLFRRMLHCSTPAKHLLQLLRCARRPTQILGCRQDARQFLLRLITRRATQRTQAAGASSMAGSALNTRMQWETGTVLPTNGSAMGSPEESPLRPCPVPIR